MGRSTTVCIEFLRTTLFVSFLPLRGELFILKGKRQVLSVQVATSGRLKRFLAAQCTDYLQATLPGIRDCLKGRQPRWRLNICVLCCVDLPSPGLSKTKKHRLFGSGFGEVCKGKVQCIQGSLVASGRQGPKQNSARFGLAEFCAICAFQCIWVQSHRVQCISRDSGGIRPGSTQTECCPFFQHSKNPLPDL